LRRPRAQTFHVIIHTLHSLAADACREGDATHSLPPSRHPSAAQETWVLR
jgi:hypothetical protein